MNENIEFTITKHLNKVLKNNNEDVPVCALILNKDYKIIGFGTNNKHRDLKITGHAEINAINEAVKTVKNLNLENCILISTLEPCMMCLGAIKAAKIKTIYFYVFSPKKGFVLSNHVIDLSKFKIKQINSNFSEIYKEMLLTFFQELRT